MSKHEGKKKSNGGEDAPCKAALMASNNAGHAAWCENSPKLLFPFHLICQNADKQTRLSGNKQMSQCCVQMQSETKRMQSNMHNVNNKQFI